VTVNVGSVDVNRSAAMEVTLLSVSIENTAPFVSRKAILRGGIRLRGMGKKGMSSYVK